MSIDKGAEWKQKLAQSRLQLRALLSSLTEEQWQTPVFSEGDAWTVATVVAHLIDSERGMSIQVHKASNERELRFFSEYVPDAVVQDYLEGTEFTVDVCADFDGRLIAVVPRERLVIRAGVSDKGITRHNTEVIEFARHVAEGLNIVGPANIQCKWDGRSASLIEVNPRFSGGIPLTIEAGADFPSWLVQMRGGRNVRPQVGRFQEDLTMMSFEDSVFARSEEVHVDREPAPRRGHAKAPSRTR